MSLWAASTSNQRDRSIIAIGARPRSVLGDNEGQPALLVLPLVQMLRRLRDHHLQRRPDMRLEQVAAHRGAVGPANHDVRMQGWLPVRADRDITHQRNNSTCSRTGILR